MTPINRPLARESAAVVYSAGRRRPVVLELDPGMPDLVGFRLRGTRTTYYLPIGHCGREAVRNELARRKAERKKLRKEQAK